MSNPALIARIQISAATATATFTPLTFATLHSEGRLIEGPAKRRATAAPGGKPAARRLNASGISRNVGRAKGTAIVAVINTAARRFPGVLKNPAGSDWTISIDKTTPMTRPGIVRSATTPIDLKNFATG